MPLSPNRSSTGSARLRRNRNCFRATSSIEAMMPSRPITSSLNPMVSSSGKSHHAPWPRRPFRLARGGRLVQLLGYDWGCQAAGDADDLVVEIVEHPGLQLVHDPRADRRAARGLLGDHGPVGALDAGLDG